MAAVKGQARSVRAKAAAGKAPAPAAAKPNRRAAAAEQVDSNDDDDDDDERDGSASDASDESDDVTEEALERMMQLLGDVDARELGLLGSDDDDDDDQDEDRDNGQEQEAEQDDSDSEFEQAQEDEQDDVDEALEFLASDDEDDASAPEDEQDDPDAVKNRRATVNDKVALERVLASFKAQAAFFDTLTLTNPKSLNVVDADNDLDRELEFYKQALWAAERASELFKKEDLPFHRPSDYFAEMVKSDAHMSTVRQSLLDEAASIKASEDARKLREAKKFGKKVQVQRQQERQKEKAEMGKRLESLKKKRKNGEGFDTTEDFDVALEDALAGAPKKRKLLESERRKGKMSRRGKDKKHGFPTSSRRPKENNARLDGDGPRRGGKAGRGGSGGRGRGRPGKNRRQ
ncbi:hypothetical protein ACM66B_005702 [Microbotryomycetes sp. NB124-2]